MSLTHECPTCHEKKPLDQFYGGRGRCKPCKSQYYKESADVRDGPRSCKSCAIEFIRSQDQRRSKWCDNCRPKPRVTEKKYCEKCEVPLEGRRRKWCSTCARIIARENASHYKRLNFRGYTEFKKDSCARCGFVGVSSVQFDIHHRDGDGLNDNPENLQTLCANCHRLATWRPALFLLPAS